MEASKAFKVPFKYRFFNRTVIDAIHNRLMKIIIDYFSEHAPETDPEIRIRIRCTSDTNLTYHFNGFDDYNSGALPSTKFLDGTIELYSEVFAHISIIINADKIRIFCLDTSAVHVEKIIDLLSVEISKITKVSTKNEFKTSIIPNSVNLDTISAPQTVVYVETTQAEKEYHAKQGERSSRITFKQGVVIAIIGGSFVIASIILAYILPKLPVLPTS